MHIKTGTILNNKIIFKICILNGWTDNDGTFTDRLRLRLGN